MKYVRTTNKFLYKRKSDFFPQSKSGHLKCRSQQRWCDETSSPHHLLQPLQFTVHSVLARFLLSFASVFFLFSCPVCVVTRSISVCVVSLFLLICLLLAPPYIMSFVLLIVCWVSVGPVIFASRSGDDVQLQFVWLVMVFLWCTEGEGCPSVLVFKSGGPNTFDSSLGVSYLDQV